MGTTKKNFTHEIAVFKASIVGLRSLSPNYKATREEAETLIKHIQGDSVLPADSLTKKNEKFYQPVQATNLPVQVTCTILPSYNSQS